MFGYFLYKDHIIKISITDYYIDAKRRNFSFAKYKSQTFKVVSIKTLDNKFINKLDDFCVHDNYAKKVDYYTSEEQIRDMLPKTFGFCRFYYDSGILKERYFVKDGQIVEGTHRFYHDH